MISKILKSTPNAVKKFFKYNRLSDMDKRILRAEIEMKQSYAKWQALLAAKDAEIRSFEAASKMVAEKYKEFGFEVVEE
jgi:predicted ribonuclease YlaK